MFFYAFVRTRPSLVSENNFIQNNVATEARARARAKVGSRSRSKSKRENDRRQMEQDEHDIERRRQVRDGEKEKGEEKNRDDEEGDEEKGERDSRGVLKNRHDLVAPFEDLTNQANLILIQNRTKGETRWRPVCINCRGAYLCFFDSLVGQPTKRCSRY